jgi:transcriptional regulator with XRE-family HTH domain
MDEASITPGALAAAVGVTPGAVSKWLSGVATPSYAHLRVVARTCGVTLDRLDPAEASVAS